MTTDPPDGADLLESTDPPEGSYCRHGAVVTHGPGNRTVPCPPWCAWVIAPDAATIILNAISDRLHGDASGADEAVQQAIARLTTTGLLVGATMTEAPPPDPWLRSGGDPTVTRFDEAIAALRAAQRTVRGDVQWRV